jgi:hypothetical protein
MYVRDQHLGFPFVSKSLWIGKHILPVEAAVATGGAAGVIMGAGQAAQDIASSKAGKTSAIATHQGENWLQSLPKSTLAIGGVSILALVAVLVQR